MTQFLSYLQELVLGCEGWVNGQTRQTKKSRKRRFSFVFLAMPLEVLSTRPLCDFYLLIPSVGDLDNFFFTTSWVEVVEIRKASRKVSVFPLSIV